MIAAPPFAAYSTMSEAVVPSTEWPYVYASLQAFKAHVQEYPGCQRLEVFVVVEDDGGIRIQCYSTWDTLDQLEAFLERGYTFERMLADTADGTVERSLVMEKLF
jgi:hypothetical protein